MLIGEHTVLRAIEEDDLEPLRAWRNQPRLRRYFREHREISRAMQRRWFERTVLADPSTRMFAICERVEHNGQAAAGRLLGAAGVCWIDWRNRSGDFSIYLGADDLYIDDVHAPEAGRLLLAYAFDELGLNRVWAEIYDHDTPKQRLLPGLGFTLEGRHRQTSWGAGRFADSLFYGLLAGERPATSPSA